MSTLSAMFASNHYSGYISNVESDSTANDQQLKAIQEIYKQTGIDMGGDGLEIES